jgi:hypothetical protein
MNQASLSIVLKVSHRYLELFRQIINRVASVFQRLTHGKIVGVNRRSTCNTCFDRLRVSNLFACIIDDSINLGLYRADGFKNVVKAGSGSFPCYHTFSYTLSRLLDEFRNQFCGLVGSFRKIFNFCGNDCEATTSFSSSTCFYRSIQRM